MSYIARFFFLFGAFSVLVLTSCESGGIFRSQKRIEGKLEGTWQIIPISSSPNEFWTFENGNLTISKVAAPDTSSEIINSGNYEVDAKFSNAFILLENLDAVGTIDLSGTWEIYDIDKEILIIFTKDLGGTITREFEKL